MKLIKRIVTILIVILFLITIPVLIQNQYKVSQVKKDLKVVLSLVKKICSSNCTEYPKEWDISGSGSKAEAELYCMRQCSNNMKGIKDSLLEYFPVLFTNKFNFRVAQFYCLIGLACPQKQITDYIENF